MSEEEVKDTGSGDTGAVEDTGNDATAIGVVETSEQAKEETAIGASTEEEEASTTDDEASEEATTEEAESEEETEEEGAPEAYEEFTLPEGVEISEEDLTSFHTLGKELDLTQAQAQELVDYQSKREQARAEGAVESK